ncbi:hypothetical protein QUC31_016648 [Theobroma cacao]|uniref:Uncharacterized protein isoform 1 n=1 Tax=Theobroma cacao TaxID=3641 RepID=A0A061EMX2_THECC|nr:Uncharacterized protein TCM_020636 isoform 1 [Theobroma cacao]
MCQIPKKRVYIGRCVRYISATDNYIKQLEQQISLPDGSDGQQQENTFHSEQASAAGHVIPLHGLEQYQAINQSQIDQRSSLSQTNSTGRGGRRKPSVLSEEEKRERKRLNDAKYRYNKRVENEKLKDEINMLRNMLQASEKGKETEALSIHGPVQDFGCDRDLPVVVGNEPSRILEENESPTNPQDASYRDLLVVMHNDVQSQSLEKNQPITYLQNDTWKSLEENQLLTQNDTWKSLEENQLLTQPQLFAVDYLTFMDKLERDEKSTVSYSDFEILLQGEKQEVGGYRIPLVLQPIFEKIVTSYGDITSNSLLSSFSAENVLLQFLATIQEMGDTTLEQVTEELIFRWRDCIAEAKRIKFNVDFATEHLKKVAKSYLGRKALNDLNNIDKRIEVLETEFNDLQRQKFEKLEACSPYLLAASEDFNRNVGLF